MADTKPDALGWPDDLGKGTLTGRFGYMDPDDYDEDREPLLSAATSGTVTVTPSITSTRYTGEQGPMLLVARGVEGVIDTEGYLCTKAADGKPGERGLVLPATDDAQLTPTGFTYQVAIRIPGATVAGFSIALPADATVDVSTAVPVPASGGTATVVDTGTADRAEAAAERAESVAGGIDEAIAAAVASGDWTGPAGRGVVSISDPDSAGAATVTYTDGATAALHLPVPKDGHTPEVGMSGDQITVDGQVVGPHLSGTPGQPGAPGAVATSSTYLVVGPGRPDQPSTTGGTITGSEPVGCEYVSTDGGGVGAWVWRKRASSWRAVDVATEWRDISSLLGPGVSGTARILRTNATVTLALDLSTDASGDSTLIPGGIPSGYRLPAQVTFFGGLYGYSWASRSWGLCRVDSALTLKVVDGGAAFVRDTITWQTTDTLPGTLPGTPA